MILATLPDWVRPTVDYIWHVGVPGTLRIAAGSVIASTVVGIAFGTLLTLRFLPSRALIRLYIEIWRGLPLIVTILMVYFLAPAVGLPTFSGIAAATIGLSLWGSAQVAEATRGAIQSIPREQHEAASALGFRWVARHVYVILPQALRRLIPPMVTLLVGIIQNSTLAAVIGAAETLSTAQRQIERLNAPPPIGYGNGHSFAILTGVAVAFFVISFPLTRLAAYLEKRLV